MTDKTTLRDSEAAKNAKIAEDKVAIERLEVRPAGKASFMKDPCLSDWLVGGGEMGRMIRSMDWAKTPLGPIEGWPQSLRTTVGLCLASNFPISLVWGPRHTQIYNDGYWPICGGKHPHSMGQDFRECWVSAWPEIGDAFERALEGETSFIENQRTFIDRNGYLEETFFTFSFSPIRDESGSIGGLFHPVTEVTGQMLSERRTQALRDLSARTSKAKTIDEAFALAAESIGKNSLDVPFALLYRLSPDQKTATLVASAGLDPGTSASPDTVILDETSTTWPLAEAICSGTGLRMENLEARFGLRPCAPYPETPKVALMLPLALSSSGLAAGILILGTSPRLPLNEVYLGFLDVLTATIANAVANARAYEEERRRVEALAELDRAKTTFFSNVSHEFRTPLTLMLGPMEDMLNKDHSSLNGEDRAGLLVVHRNGLRLLKLVNMLLDFSRIEAGRVQANYEKTDIGPLTANLASVFRAAIEKAGMELDVDCPPIAGQVYVDRDMWEKIVLNLVSNAFKFTLEGRITVRLRESAGHIEMTVTDTGLGIPEHELPHLFERFHRVEGVRGRTHEGSGIGLALTLELARLHGGSINAKSAVGQGSRFTVRLPIGKEHLPQQAIGKNRSLSSNALGAAAFGEEASSWHSVAVLDVSQDPAKRIEMVEARASARSVATVGARILFADDNADMRDYVGKLLEGQGWVVEAVGDGNEAFSRAQRSPPDLVLSDVMMPVLDGFGLLKALRANPATSALPVILLSARAGEESRVEGMAAHADDYLVKPFSARELIARVGAHLEMARVRREAAERERALHQELKDARGRLDAALEAGQIATFTWDVASDCVFADRNLQKLFAVSAEDADGGPLARYFQAIHPADREQVKAVLEKALAAGDRCEADYRIAEDGGVERSVSAYARIERDKAGRACVLTGVVIDITKRKKTEAALQESEKRYRNLFNSIDEGFCIIDMIFDERGKPIDYRFLEVNPTFEKQSGLYNVIGKRIRELRPQHEEYWFEIYGKVVLTGETSRFEAESKSLDGRSFDIYALKVGEPESCRVAVIFNDITERKNKEEKLRASEAESLAAKESAEAASRSKSQFLANMSHEIRTPLGAILGYSEFLREPNLGHEERLAFIDTINRNGRDLAQLIDDILDLSKVEAGRIEIEKLRLSLPNLLTDVTTSLGVKAREKGLALTVLSDGTVPETIESDPTRLRQILLNVIGNAIKFTKQGSVTVTVKLLKRDDGRSSQLAFFVKDTGHGIAPDEQDRLFSAFMQADASTTRKFGGTGLGLALSRVLARALGGDVLLSESVPGQGSTFVVSVEVGRVETTRIIPLVGEYPQAATFDKGTLQGIKVLVAEDSLDNQLLITRILKRAGASVDLAENGADAIKQALGSDYDLVLMDMQMPVLDGFDATTELRRRGYKRPIIALTAHAMREEREKSLRAGCDDHLTKPVNFKHLVYIVSQYASHH